MLCGLCALWSELSIRVIICFQLGEIFYQSKFNQVRRRNSAAHRRRRVPRVRPYLGKRVALHGCMFVMTKNCLWSGNMLWWWRQSQIRLWGNAALSSLSDYMLADSPTFPPRKSTSERLLLATFSLTKWVYLCECVKKVICELVVKYSGLNYTYIWSFSLAC